MSESLKFKSALDTSSAETNSDNLTNFFHDKFSEDLDSLLEKKRLEDADLAVALESCFNQCVAEGYEFDSPEAIQLIEQSVGLPRGLLQAEIASGLTGKNWWQNLTSPLKPLKDFVFKPELKYTPNDLKKPLETLITADFVVNLSQIALSYPLAVAFAAIIGAPGSPVAIFSGLLAVAGVYGASSGVVKQTLNIEHKGDLRNKTEWSKFAINRIMAVLAFAAIRMSSTFFVGAGDNLKTTPERTLEFVSEKTELVNTSLSSSSKNALKSLEQSSVYKVYELAKQRQEKLEEELAETQASIPTGADANKSVSYTSIRAAIDGAVEPNGVDGAGKTEYSRKSERLTKELRKIPNIDQILKLQKELINAKERSNKPEILRIETELTATLSYSDVLAKQKEISNATGSKEALAQAESNWLQARETVTQTNEKLTQIQANQGKVAFLKQILSNNPTNEYKDLLPRSISDEILAGLDNYETIPPAERFRIARTVYDEMVKTNPKSVDIFAVFSFISGEKISLMLSASLFLDFIVFILSFSVFSKSSFNAKYANERVQRFVNTALGETRLNIKNIYQKQINAQKANERTFLDTYMNPKSLTQANSSPAESIQTFSNEFAVFEKLSTNQVETSGGEKPIDPAIIKFINSAPVQKSLLLRAVGDESHALNLLVDAMLSEFNREFSVDTYEKKRNVKNLQKNTEWNKKYLELVTQVLNGQRGRDFAQTMSVLKDISTPAKSATGAVFNYLTNFEMGGLKSPQDQVLWKHQNPREADNAGLVYELQAKIGSLSDRFKNLDKKLITDDGVSYRSITSAEKSRLTGILQSSISNIVQNQSTDETFQVPDLSESDQDFLSKFESDLGEVAEKFENLMRDGLVGIMSSLNESPATIISKIQSTLDKKLKNNLLDRNPVSLRSINQSIVPKYLIDAKTNLEILLSLKPTSDSDLEAVLKDCINDINANFYQRKEFDISSNPRLAALGSSRTAQNQINLAVQQALDSSKLNKFERIEEIRKLLQVESLKPFTNRDLSTMKSLEDELKGFIK